MRLLTSAFAALLLLGSQAEATTLNLTDLMNSHYGVGGWAQRTGVGMGTDIGPALTDGLTALRSSGGRGIIHIPAGTWEYTTPVSDTLLSGNYIEGEGSQASVIVYNNAGSVAFYWSGAGGFTGGGMRHIGLLLESGLGDTNAYGVLLSGNATYQPDQMEFDDIYQSAIGGTSFWYTGFQADGSARTAPQGLRVIQITNYQSFNNRNLAFYFRNVVQGSVDNIGAYTGKGNGNDIYITGAGTSSTNTVQFSATRIVVGGTLHLDNASDVKIQGRAAALSAATTADYVSGWLHTPTVSGSVGSNSNLTIRN